MSLDVAGAPGSHRLSLNPPRARRRQLAPVPLLAPAVVLLVVFLAIPLVGVVRVSLASGSGGADVGGISFDQYAAFAGESFYSSVLLNTASTAGLATLLTLLVAYPFALYMTFGVDRFRRYLVLAILSPLLISGVVRSYALVYLLGPGNPIDQAGLPFNILNTRGAVMIGLVHTLLPFMVLSIVASLNSVDPRVIAAARSLGAPTRTVIRRIVVPLSAPGILAGCLIVFNLAITSFAIPLLLGGSSYKMLVSLIYQQVLLLFNWPFGFAITLILLALSALTMYLAGRLGSRTPEQLLQ
jgi:putative spermidine/putrescine transport system permease protein